MSEDKKSALLMAAKKLKSAKKNKAEQSEVSGTPTKNLNSDVKSSAGDKLGEKIVGAVHQFKGV